MTTIQRIPPPPKRKAVVIRCDSPLVLQAGIGIPMLVADSIQQAGQWLKDETNLRHAIGIHPNQPLPAFQSERYPVGDNEWKWHLAYRTPGNVLKFLIVRHIEAL